MMKKRRKPVVKKEERMRRPLHPLNSGICDSLVSIKCCNKEFNDCFVCFYANKQFKAKGDRFAQELRCVGYGSSTVS